MSITHGLSCPFGGDRWIRWTTIGCAARADRRNLSYLHMHLPGGLHSQPGWVAALTPLSVDGMIVAASTTLLADLRPFEVNRDVSSLGDCG